MVLTAALRAFTLIFHAAARRLLVKTLLLTLLVFALLAVGLWAGFHALRLHYGWGGGGLAEAAATALVKDAIRAGIFNDLGSGSNVDVTIIRTGGEATVLRGYETPNDTRPLREAYVRPKALVPVKATAVLSTQVEVTDADAMEL